MADNEKFLVSFLKNDTTRELANKARNQYARNYRAKHKQRVKEAQTRYWVRKAKEMQQDNDAAFTMADLLGADAKNQDGSSKTFGQLVGKEYKEYLEFLASTNERAKQELAVLNDMLEKGEISL